VSASSSQFAGYDTSFDTEQKVRLGDGTTVTVQQKKRMPIVSSSAVQTSVAVTAATVLETVTGQRLGADPAAWRRWWEEQGASAWRGSAEPAPR
jgi:hypothetical protein